MSATAAVNDAPASATPAVIALDQIVQEYPRPEGGVNRVVDNLSLRFTGPVGLRQKHAAVHDGRRAPAEHQHAHQRHHQH